MLILEKDNFLYGIVVQQKMHANKYEKHFPKMLKDVGMAVQKPHKLDIWMAVCRGLHK